MRSLEGFILAGGASSRMGTDKAELQLGKQTFVDRIAAALRGITPKVSVVGAAATSANAGLNSVPDVFEKWGALGGLHGALCACQAPWAAVVACDLPFVTAALFGRLASLCRGYDAVAPVQPDGRPQPLCALYRVSVCRDQADKLIRAGQRRPVMLLETVNTRWVSFAELTDLVGAALFFDNINTPDDYARAKNKEQLRVEAMNEADG